MRGEMALCTLSAINVAKVTTDEQYERTAYTIICMLNKLIDEAEFYAHSIRRDLRNRRSLGVGITGLAEHLHNVGKSYSDKDYIEEIAERHYYFLLKASQRYAREHCVIVEGIKKNWLPIDTKKSKKKPTRDWEALRGLHRANSVLVAHMPTESSSVFSGSSNGLYPSRGQVIDKSSRKGKVQFILPKMKETAWDISTTILTEAYAVIQGYTDQGISADYYIRNGKIPMSELIEHWVLQAKLEVKSMYYQNTNDDNGGSFMEACESGACVL